MTDFNKKVKNPLFNTAVTGGTIEDFSQNALLLPAKEKTPPILNLSPEQPPRVEENPNYLETIPTSIDTFQNQQPCESNEQIFPQQFHNPVPEPEQSSNLSSVFSSFSNILKLKGSSQTYTSPPDDSVPPPAGIETIINQDSTNVAPIPLFPASGTINSPPKSATAQGPLNTYRRSGLKRPVYAQVPGLSNQQSPSVPNLAQAQPSFLPPQPSFQPSQPSLPPQKSSYQPPQSSVQPPQPSFQPPQPSIEPLQPSFQPPQPSLQPLQPSFQPPQPSFQPPQPALQPPQPPLQPPQPSLQPLQPSFQPAQPSLQPLQPSFQPPQPSLQPSQPSLQPPQPSLQSLQPSFQPLQPSFQSLQPSFQPPQPSFPPPPPSFQASQPTFQPASQVSNYFQLPSKSNSSSILSEFTPPPSASPALSVSSTQDSVTPSSHFKPISPQPTTFLNPVTAPQSIPPLSVPIQQTRIFNPISSFSGSSTNIQSPVMAAIPANELLQASNINVGSTLSADVNGENLPSTNVTTNQIYRPVYHHWFYKREVEGKVLWTPFSMIDSLTLDQAFTSNDLDPDKVVATDGGRYDVNILRRERVPVYWKGSPSEVRRCSWFHKGNSDGRYVPYEENIATKLEEEFKAAFESNQWHRKVELLNGETVVFHAADVLVLFPPTQSPDAWGNTPNQLRPRIVKRGMDEFDIDEGEPAKVDHLLFLVHGIGSVCDLKFRTVEEVVDEFRSISLQLVQSHYRSSCERGKANRIEVLPISWHQELHSEDTGIDRKLKSITLDSIPRLRDFTNDTLLDILFYTSPIYCQTIMSTVGNQLNKIYDLFKQRNPDFDGGVSLGGHSLGSLILFDLLCHQHPEPEKATSNQDEDTITPLNDPKPPPPLERRMSRRISYMMSAAGTGQPQIQYPHLNFQPKSFFALGSPIGMFVTVRGLDTLGEQFALPTCPAFFNIFHPYDPVAYRVESLINPELAKLKPVLIPHHKGRKRMHLELKETMAKVGADLKQRVIDSMKSTWNSFYQLAMFHRQDQASLEEEVDKALQQQMREREEEQTEEPEQPTDVPLGLLNSNRRIDYVLQEAPFEFFNEYIFALTSHVCYWESEDTMLLILKEIYDSMNISADDKIPQQSMTIERPPPSPNSARAVPNLPVVEEIGMDPTMPIQQNVRLGPPPTSGFVKKT